MPRKYNKNNFPNTQPQNGPNSSNYYDPNTYGSNSASYMNHFNLRNEEIFTCNQGHNNENEQTNQIVCNDTNTEEDENDDNNNIEIRTIRKTTLIQIFEMPIFESANPTYTDGYWRKHNQKIDPSKGYNSYELLKNHKSLTKTRLFEKKVNDMMSAPVEISKGKSLLEKMGWTGGGLGKDGEGIVEPIAPTAKYAASTMGLGLLSLNPKPKKKVQTVGKQGERVYGNTLLCLLDFVKNDTEIELLFDKSLSQKERRRVHVAVQELRECKTKKRYAPLVDKINEHNHYVLYTESEGEGNDRQLTVYKEAPDYVYLITPKDLHYECDEEEEKNKVEEEEKGEEDNGGDNEKEEKDNGRDNEKEEKDNGRDNEKEEKGNGGDNEKEEKDNGGDSEKEEKDNGGDSEKEEKDENVIMDTIVKYFLEFTSDEQYTEFRFLGPFRKDDRRCIDMFFDVCKGSVEIPQSEEVLSLFEDDSICLEIEPDSNGRKVILKNEKWTHKRVSVSEDIDDYKISFNQN